MNSYKEDYELNHIFQEEFDNNNSSKKNEITLDRINQLFQNGSISASEHSALIAKFLPTEKRISVFALLSLATSTLNWILILKFTFNDEVYQLLNGETRYHISLFLAPLSLIFFALAKIEISKKSNTKGFEVAIAGLTLALAVLTVTLPLLIWKILQ